MPGEPTGLVATLGRLTRDPLCPPRSLDLSPSREPNRLPPPAALPLCYLGLATFRLEGLGDSFHRTPRVDHAARRRGSGVAAHGAGAAAGEATDHRVVWDGRGFGVGPVDHSFCAAAARTRLDRGAHRRDPLSLDGGTRRALGRDRGRIRPAQGRCHCHGRKRGCRGKAGVVGHPDRVRAYGRPA